MKLTWKQQLAAAATLSVAAVGGAQAACTGGNSAGCSTAAAQSDTTVAQANATGGNTTIKTPPVGVNLNLGGSNVGAGAVSTTFGQKATSESPTNVGPFGAWGKGKTVVDTDEKALPVMECNNGVNGLNATANAASALPYVADKREIVSTGVQGMIQKCGIVLKKALNCAAGLIQNITKDACIPDPEVAAQNLAAQKAAAEKAAIEKAADEKIAAADKAAADRIAAAEKAAAEQITAANKAVAAARKAAKAPAALPKVNDCGAKIWDNIKTAETTKAYADFMKACKDAAAAQAPAAAKAPAPAAAKAPAPAASR